MYRELSFQIPRKYEGKTIRNFLKEYGGFTKKEISQAKFRPGGFRLDGIQRRCDALLREGQELLVCVEAREQGSSQLVWGEGTLEILYEDEDLLVVNKPAGTVCHPAKGHYGDTLANQAANYYGSRGEKVTIRCVGRLDKEVSGVVVFAKNQMAAARLSTQREQGTFSKKYVALVQGLLEEDSLLLLGAIGPHDRDPHRMQLRPDGKASRTRVRVQERRERENQTLVCCEIHTGRMHQIRVHLSGAGHPIVGDLLYGAEAVEGEEEQGRRGICLHAWQIQCENPFTGKQILVCAPLPFWARRDW